MSSEEREDEYQVDETPGEGEEWEEAEVLEGENTVGDEIISVLNIRAIQQAVFNSVKQAVAKDIEFKEKVL